MAKPKVSEQGFQEAADLLKVEVAAIKAVAKVEAPKGGFIEDGRVTILFERHKFYKYTGGAFAASHPQICNKKAGGYAKTTEGEYVRFSQAIVRREIDRAAIDIYERVS